MAEELKAPRDLMYPIINFWETYEKPMMEKISVDMSLEEKKAMLLKMFQGAKDLNEKGEKMPWTEQKIQNNETKCVKGTILSVNRMDEEGSLIFAIQKKFVTAVRVWYDYLLTGNKFNYKGNCQKYCNGCTETNESVCCQVIKDLIEPTFGEKGVFAQVKEKLSQDIWKL